MPGKGGDRGAGGSEFDADVQPLCRPLPEAKDDASIATTTPEGGKATL
jgi:hypothetical protein